MIKFHAPRRTTYATKKPPRTTTHKNAARTSLRFCPIFYDLCNATARLVRVESVSRAAYMIHTLKRRHKRRFDEKLITYDFVKCVPFFNRAFIGR